MGFIFSIFSDGIQGSNYFSASWCLLFSMAMGLVFSCFKKIWVCPKVSIADLFDQIRGIHIQLALPLDDLLRPVIGSPLVCDVGTDKNRDLWTCRETLKRMKCLGFFVTKILNLMIGSHDQLEGMFVDTDRALISLYHIVDVESMPKIQKKKWANRN